ncbi:MAG: class I SAM-dependent DNA methyltransferase [Flavobacteriales bacterium]|nr:class I SAM-dependent DNA methyltransferase [Flavobacteriales bacterium]
MALGWNEIRDRAVQFSREWAGEQRERAEKDTFWNDFFHVYGINRRRVATFEEPVKKLGNRQGFIDLFWKGNMLVEHKSRGSDLDAAFTQANDYFAGIKDYELPKYVLVSDFNRFRLYDLEDGSRIDFLLQDFPEHVKAFGFIAGYQKKTYRPEDPVNVQAAELMGRIYDELRASGYEGHPLEVLLVRMLFCLFADDTGIFGKDILRDYIDLRTREDGTDLGMALAQLFQVLDTPEKRRQRTLDEQLAAFPYINGSLFTEQLPIAAFNLKMRSLLLQCCALDWGRISPAIFGSMFQSVMNPKERRDLGAHYTSETNILKLIRPLFLDDLWDEFHRVKGNANRLATFHKKIGDLRFLDPACGCGNFLVITYRELRLLEIEILRMQLKGQQVLNIEDVIWMNVDQFYGIEYDEWPARIAEVALWLMDHQMNQRIKDEFGNYFARIPLTKSATIVHGNALRIDWETLADTTVLDVSADRVNVFQLAEPREHYGTVNVYARSVPPPDRKVNYILGNPPFLGGKFQSANQKEDMEQVFGNLKGSGVLDYVAAWYMKAARYIENTNIKVAFVSTNSIAQGEQVSVLWGELFNRYGVKLHFAHRTFSWSNEARGNAAVHVVIIGFGTHDIPVKRLFEYDDLKGEPHEVTVQNINPYLVAGTDTTVVSRTTPLCPVPRIAFGNQPNDGGGFLFTDDEYRAFIEEEPGAQQFIRPFVGSFEFINNVKRWCLWLKDAEPTVLRKLPRVLDRIEVVRQHRLSSTREATVELAHTPTLFGFVSHTERPYVIIPSVSSERRKYIPMGFMPADVIASNLCLIVPDAEIYHFGILTSGMHMAWVSHVGGRLKSDYRYSNKIVYNNYPWPKEPTAAQRKDVEEKAEAVLDARAKYPTSSLADLYDPLTMPPDLMKAHQALDKAVDKCYRAKGFGSETERVEFLFGLYGEYVKS